MNQTVDAALGLWGLAGADYTLIAARENAVYKVTTATQTVAMRLHRPGYRTNAELRSELDWTAAVRAGGIPVPNPLPTTDGGLLVEIDGTQVDVVTWVTGDTLDNVLADADTQTRTTLFHRLGQTMARLHDVCDAWQTPAGFDRPAWDTNGLLGDAPLWGRFWDNPALAPHDRDLLLQLRQTARDRLAKMPSDYGLIHADLVAGNVMTDGPNLTLIDFDDGGYGFRLFEIATALLKHTDAPDYPILSDALIEGYTTERALDLAQLDLFIALRAATYVGWNITRMSETGGAARNARFVHAATHHATRLLG